ncbi:MAG: sigma-54-dependent Fis family transcriptional regulator [Nitrospirae bacterium]|nr:sigma-54-dependent Fis family transcriptional regulator [Nitrospirota bacterium]
MQVVLLDLALPDLNGLDGLRDIISSSADSSVIVLTSQGARENALEAMKEGAYCYIEKPLNVEELKVVIERAFTNMLLRKELKRLKDIDAETPKIIGKSEKMVKVSNDIRRASAKDSGVLITGEYGTGKNLVAKAVHYNSRRISAPFIAVDCASVQKEEIETELFGYEKGASKEKCKNKIESADGGTLFINEISELDSNLQGKLLKFLQEKEFTPSGTKSIIKADIRIIGATRKNLKDAVSKGTFKEELYNKLSAIHIKLPPLKDHKDDILPLTKYFIKDAHEKCGIGNKELSKEARDFLMEYDWPGNVRELENTIRKACILSKGMAIQKSDLHVQDGNSYTIKEFFEDKLLKYMADITKLGRGNLHTDVISEVEKALMSIVLKETKGNQLKTAQILGINRNTLRTKIKEYKIR